MTYDWFITERQKKIMDSFGLHYTPKMPKDYASDLINHHKKKHNIGTRSKKRRYSEGGMLYRFPDNTKTAVENTMAVFFEATKKGWKI